MVLKTHPRIRPAAAAGTFYPADPVGLATLVDGWLIGTGEQATDEQPRILIAPHAGYRYSGAVAAAGFAGLNAVEQVILSGCSHYQHIDGAALCGADRWQTPLGDVTVDQPAMADLLRSSPLFHVNDGAHQPEHALEVQLPFLQRALDDFTIIPILLSRVSANEAQAMIREVARLVQAGALLVVSSDLSHYPCQADAEQVDRRTIDAILSGDAEHLQTVIDAQMAARVPGLSTCACGAAAIKLALQVARHLHLSAARLLAYTHSGCVSGQTARVVGYAAIGFYA
jgi:hypothetical protein